ncbi:MAG TPA: AAA family ATPase [Prevotella sp.]|nr:AAA family ATPase [Prevotella sp.]
MKYPIGIQDFDKIINEGYTYVDKTELIYKLVHEGSYYFLSRPRRFGKSLLMSTLEAYFSGKRELFHGLAIDKLKKEWTVYPVLHLDLNTGKYDTKDSLFHVLDDFLCKLEATYGTFPSEKALELRFMGLIARIYEKTGKPVVILVDEYDKPLLQSINNKELQDDFRATLKAFYSALKTQDRYIRFALLTGVTKFGKVSVFSDLNNLTDISMDESYDTLCGITEEEMHRYFEEGIQKLADRYDISYEEACARLKKRYDGYHFVEYGTGVYNPFSLLSTFRANKFGSFWFETGTPTFLVQLLQRENFYLPDLTQQQVSADMLNSIDAMDRNPIPVIYQSGYLTIKDYDEEFKVYTLGFPNEEVEEGFANYLLPYYAHTGSEGAPMYVRNFVLALRNGKPEEFMKRMQVLFADTDYKIVGNAELYFQNAFYIVTKLLGFYTEVERTISDGRIDMIVKTKDYIYIFEFKYDQSADTALQQIEDKGYAKPFATDGRKIVKIGVNFSREHRCIDEWKIKE